MISYLKNWNHFWANKKAEVTPFFCYIMLNPHAGLCAFGCSIFSPSMSQRYCCGVMAFASCAVLGHWYTPCSRRLYTRTNPSPSQYRPLILSLLSAAEQKQRVRERVKPERVLYQRRQSVDPLPQVSIPARDIYLIRTGEVTQHARAPAATSAASLPLRRRRYR